MTADSLTHSEREAWAEAVMQVNALRVQAEADRDTLLDALAKLEWIPGRFLDGGHGADGCPSCWEPRADGLEPGGHAPDCSLAAALARVRSHTGKDPA